MDHMIIPLNDWAAGERQYRFHAGLEFFQTFDNSEILDADVNVEVLVAKEGMRRVEADLHLSGTVTVACDRCLEPLVLPVDAEPSFSVRFDVPEDDFSELGKEVLPLSAADADLDLRQAVYDYVCLSLPLQRVHPEGECNPDTIRFLSQEERKDEEAEAQANSPFAALKGLFDSK